MKMIVTPKVEYTLFNSIPLMAEFEFNGHKYIKIPTIGGNNALCLTNIELNIAHYSYFDQNRVIKSEPVLKGIIECAVNAFLQLNNGNIISNLSYCSDVDKVSCWNFNKKQKEYYDTNTTVQICEVTFES